MFLLGSLIDKIFIIINFFLFVQFQQHKNYLKKEISNCIKLRILRICMFYFIDISNMDLLYIKVGKRKGQSEKEGLLQWHFF